MITPSEKCKMSWNGVTFDCIVSAIHPTEPDSTIDERDGYDAAWETGNVSEQCWLQPLFATPNRPAIPILPEVGEWCEFSEFEIRFNSGLTIKFDVPDHLLGHWQFNGIGSSGGWKFNRPLPDKPSHEASFSA